MEYNTQQMTEQQAFAPPVADNGTENVNMTDVAEGGEKVNKIPKFLRGVSADGRVKKRRSSADKHKMLKKRVQPKNAVVCLNELRTGVSFNVENKSSFGKPMCVSVEVDGKKFIGTGTSIKLAKQDAAEAALISFVKPSPDKDAAAVEGVDVPEDTTPWGVLASFAMYKLFNKWVTDQAEPDFVPMQMQPEVVQMTLPTVQVNSEQKQIISSYLGKPIVVPAVQVDQPMKVVEMSRQAQNPAKQLPPAVQVDQPMKVVEMSRQAQNSAKQLPPAVQVDQSMEVVEISRQAKNPAKQLPANASTMHPMMLLHQMVLGLKFEHVKTKRESDQQTLFNVQCSIKDQIFIGEGTNLKKAKLELATKANEQIFGVVYVQA